MSYQLSFVPLAWGFIFLKEWILIGFYILGAESWICIY